MSEKIVKLVSVWKKRPKGYKLRHDQVMVQLLINAKGFWQTRHLPVDKSDPILKG